MSKEEIIKQLFEEEYEGSTYESSLFSVYKELVERCMDKYVEVNCKCEHKIEENGTKEETLGQGHDIRDIP